MRFAILVVLALLPLTAQAQTVPAMAPHEPALRRCFQQLMGDAGASLAEADRLLATPALPPVPHARASACRAQALATLGRAAEAEAQAEQVLGLLDSHPLPEAERLPVLFNSGSVLQQIGRHERAMEVFQHAYGLARESDSKPGQMNALANLGLIHAIGMNDPEAAEPYFRKASELSERRGAPLPGDAMMLYNYGYTLLQLKRYDEAMAQFDKVLVVSRQMPNQELNLQRTNSHRGEILRQTGKVEEGRRLLEAAAAWQRERPDPQGEAVTLVRLASLHLEDSDAERALPLAQRALSLSEKGRFPSETLASLKLLSGIHTALGQLDQAMALSQRAHAQEIETLRRQSVDRIGKLQAQVQNVVGSENLAVANSLARAQLLRNLAVGALLLVLVAGALIVIRQRRTHRRLRHTGNVDPVTGLTSQPLAREHLDALSLQPEKQAALLLINVDGLDGINHDHGQAQGDKVLRVIADCAKRECRNDDLVARWAGAQILVLRQDTSEAAAQALAEHLRNAIGRAAIAASDGAGISVTASIGLAPYPLFPDDMAARIDDSVQLADRVLRMVRRSAGDGWASLWGLPAGTGTVPSQLRQAPQQAQANGLVSLGSSRPLDWDDSGR